MLTKIKNKLLKIRHLKYKIIVHYILILQWLLLILALFCILKLTVFHYICAVIFIILSFKMYRFSESYTRDYWKFWNDSHSIKKPTRFVRRKIKQKFENKWH